MLDSDDTDDSHKLDGEAFPEGGDETDVTLADCMTLHQLPWALWGFIKVADQCYSDQRYHSFKLSRQAADQSYVFWCVKK